MKLESSLTSHFLPTTSAEKLSGGGWPSSIFHLGPFHTIIILYPFPEILDAHAKSNSPFISFLLSLSQIEKLPSTKQTGSRAGAHMFLIFPGLTLDASASELSSNIHNTRWWMAGNGERFLLLK
jgi:hypothetical protein